MAGPLAGVTVLDMTQFLSGPYGTQILGDMGAEIIKVEPFSGDTSRGVPPHFVAGDSAYYVSANRNKQSIVIDARNPQGLDLIKQLIAKADVLIENYRPGVMKRLGLEYDDLKKDHPGLIWCSISGFGQSGPTRDRPAYDMVVQALSGGMSLTGEPGRPPVRAGIPLGDLASGMYAVIGILGALNRKRDTGLGDQIDISMLDCQIAMLSYQAAYYLHSGEVPIPQGRGHDSIPTYGCFTAQDGRDVAICANSQKMWCSLCEVLGHPELVEDPLFTDMATRLKNRKELDPLLQRLFLAKPAAEWAQLLEDAGIPVATVNTLDLALSEPQVLHRQMVLDLQGDHVGQRARVAGNPLKFAEAQGAPHRYPPAKGADTREILKRHLNLQENVIDKLLDEAVIGTPV